MKIQIERSFSVIPNGLLFDSKLSMKAKGIWAYIHAKPDGWDFSAERIAKECTEGKDSIRSGLSELEKYWYLERIQKKNAYWHWEYEYILHELYSINYTAKKSDCPMADFPTTDCPTTEKPVINKDRDTKTEVEIQNITERSPREETGLFFKTLEEDIESLIFSISEDPKNHDFIKKELGKFSWYWRERRQDGKKERWECEKTFEWKRRLVTWFEKAQQYSTSKFSPYEKKWRLAR